MNVASGIVLIIAGLTAVDPSARGGYDQYGQVEKHGNDFNFVPDGYGTVLPQNFGFNPLHNAFGNNSPQYQRAVPRFGQPIVRDYQDSGNKFRQVSDNLNGHFKHAVRPENGVPLIASRIAPFPIRSVVNRGSEDSQNFPKGDRNSVSFANSPLSGLNPDFLKSATSASSAASASSRVAQTISRLSGSQNFDSHGPRSTGHSVPSASDIVTQGASGFFGQRPDFFRPPTSGFPQPSAPNVIAQATFAFSGSQDSNSRKPFNIVHQVTSGLSPSFNSSPPPISKSQASNSFKSSGSGSSSPASLFNASQRIERSRPLTSTSNNDQFTTSQPITQITPNSVVKTTTATTTTTTTTTATPPPPPPPPTTTTTSTTTGSVQPPAGEVVASASSATASASSVTAVVSENNGSGTVTKVSSNTSTSTSTSTSASSTSIEAPVSTATSSNPK